MSDSNPVRQTIDREMTAASQYHQTGLQIVVGKPTEVINNLTRIVDRKQLFSNPAIFPAPRYSSSNGGYNE